MATTTSTNPTVGLDLPVGPATLVGSLPHTEPEAAVRFVLERFPELPSAPALPRREPRERMLAQAAWGIAGVAVSRGGRLSVDHDALDPDAPLRSGLGATPFDTTRSFLGGIADRHGPVKLQLTGPVTLGLALLAAGAPTLLAFRVAEAAVRARATALLDAAQAAAPKATLVAVVAEPRLADALRPSAPLDVDAVVDLVSSTLAAIEPRAVTGLHCCRPTDWSAVLAAGPQIVSLPVGADVAASAGALGTFLEEDGWIAWGAVPTRGPLGDSAARLWRGLSKQWADLEDAGCDPIRLRRQAIITPACGLGSHTLAQAGQVVELTRQLASRLHDQLAGLCMSS